MCFASIVYSADFGGIDHSTEIKGSVDLGFSDLGALSTVLARYLPYPTKYIKNLH